MLEKEDVDYQRVKKAIEFLALNFRNQPSLDELALEVGMSNSHFQRMFSAWAGVSPKKFLQFTTLEYAKSILKKEQLSLFDTAYESGLSGTGRLHDLFVNLEAMTPGEFKNGGESLIIKYQFADTIFGKVIVASTPKGICQLRFFTEKKEALKDLKLEFPQATLIESISAFNSEAIQFFQLSDQDPGAIKLHLKASPFQLKVWEALLKIPSGDLHTYGQIADEIGNAGASRAVGTAIATNPIAYLIPCHRVIRSSGEFGQYRWEASRKLAMIGLEGALLYQEIDV